MFDKEIQMKNKYVCTHKTRANGERVWFIINFLEKKNCIFVEKYIVGKQSGVDFLDEEPRITIYNISAPQIIVAHSAFADYSGRRQKI